MAQNYFLQHNVKFNYRGGVVRFTFSKKPAHQQPFLYTLLLLQNKTRRKISFLRRSGVLCRGKYNSEIINISNNLNKISDL